MPPQVQTRTPMCQSVFVCRHNIKVPLLLVPGSLVCCARRLDQKAHFNIYFCKGLAGAAKVQEGEGRVKRFLPFSSGTRDCVGQSLARMNYTATVAMLLARFRFELADKVDQSACLSCAACTCPA